MAKIIDSFPVNGKGPQFRGDPQWFNGQIWRLDITDDLSGYKTINVARQALVQYARNRNLAVRTSIHADEGFMVMQATLKRTTVVSELGGTLDDW